MSVKGRKSRQWRYKPADRGFTLKAIVKSRRTVGREHLPQRKARKAWPARETLADALKEAPVDSGAEEEEVCAGYGLEECAWLRNQGEGYVGNGERYCCQGCAEGRQCPCQG
jgi:hypothetical protein